MTLRNHGSPLGSNTYEKHKLLEKGLKLKNPLELKVSIFTKKMFPSFAGSCEILADHISKLHAKSVFGKLNKDTINKETLKKGVSSYVDCVRKKSLDPAPDLPHMYL